MSSKPIYPHVPYFYVIEHIASGKRYAGCRYAKGCHPSEFMTEGGYCTSSSTVKQIINEEGLDAFVVVEIKTMDEVGDVYDYETKFLVENDCAASDQWFNMHNNAVIAFGSKEFKAAMKAKHGVEHATLLEEFKEKQRQTCLKNHGVEYSLQSEEIREKVRKTNLSQLGYEHPMQSESVKAKSRKTCLDRYGFEYSLQSEEVRKKSRASLLDRYGVQNALQSDKIKETHRQTCLKNHGVENVSQSEKVKEQKIQTCLNNRGVEYPMQSEEVKEKSRQACLNHYGVENVSQSEEVKEQKRQTWLKNYGVDHAMKTKEHQERQSKLNYEKFDLKVRTEILNGDFSRFEYLYDTVEHVFIIGVQKSLNRGLETKRYINIRANRNFKKYIDVLTGAPYKIDVSKFSTALPENFVKP